MSTFKRTTSGLNNQHLFHDVDLIIFLEGGNKSFTKTEVLAGKYHTETEDVIFWKNIFTKFITDKKIKFKSVGSKTTIKDIALDIVDGKLKTILVAMDNEFDEVFKRRILHPQIYYTHGYSWENDIWNHDVIKAVIEELTAVKIENDHIESNFAEFLKHMKAAVNADGYMFKKGSSFFPRSGYLFCVECTPIDLPHIKTTHINARFNSKGLTRATVNSFGRRYSIETLKFCYGHLLADYCCQVIIHYLKKRHSLPNIPKDIIYRMGINNFFKTSFKDGHIFEYYESKFP